MASPDPARMRNSGAARAMREMQSAGKGTSVADLNKQTAALVAKLKAGKAGGGGGGGGGGKLSPGKAPAAPKPASKAGAAGRAAGSSKSNWGWFKANARKK